MTTCKKKRGNPPQVFCDRLIASSLICCLVPLLLVACSKRQQKQPDSISNREGLALSPYGGNLLPVDIRLPEPSFADFANLAQGITVSTPKPVPIKTRLDPLKAGSLFYSEHEPNNTQAEATLIGLPAEIHGTVDWLPESADGDHDWFEFKADLDRPVLLHVDVSGVPGVDLALVLLQEGAANRTTRIHIDDTGIGTPETIPNFRLTNGRYLLDIHQTLKEGDKPAYNVKTPYKALLQLKELPENEETEPNDRALDAVALTIPVQLTGILNSKTDVDWYLVEFSGPVKPFLSIDVVPAMSANIELAVLSQTEEVLTKVSSEGGKPLSVPNLAVPGKVGAYYVVISTSEKRGALGKYDLAVRIPSEPPPGDILEGEPNDDLERAQKIAYEESVAGWLHHDKDVDWFRLEPADWGAPDEEGKSTRPALNLILSSVAEVDVAFELIDGDGRTQLALFDSRRVGKGEEAPNLPMPDKTVYLKVYSRSGSNSATPYILQALGAPTEGKEVEPNNRPDQATQLTADDVELMGFIAPPSDRDCLFLPPRSGIVKVEAPRVGSLRVTAYGEDGAMIDQTVADADKPGVIKRPAGALTLCLELVEQSRQPKDPWVLRLLSSVKEDTLD